MSSDQEKILLLQKEFHLSQLGLKECGVELQRIRARILQDLLDLEICHHINERKAYDVELAQLKDQFEAARSEVEQIKLIKAKPLKARVLRNETVKDILCSSVSVTMPTEPKDLTMEQEASVVMDDTSSLSLNTVNIASAIEGINHGCHGDMCSTEQATDNINIETITDSIDNNDIIKNDASQSPNMHRGSPAICSQGLPLGRVGQSESTDGQGNEAQVREEIDLQVLDSTVTTMKLESQKKPKNKKDVSRKKKGRRGRRKKNCMAEQVTIVPDSTGIQNGYSVVANSENVAINNSELQSSPEPSVSSTSNRADDGQMATSSNYQRPVINDDQKFVAVKKLKLENNLINSPSNLVTSTSNNIQHDISVSRLPPPDTVMVVGNSSVNDDPILPSTSVSQGISVSSKDTSEPQGIDDVIVPSKDTSELQGINDIIVPSKDTSEPQGIDDIIVPSKVTSKPRGINRRKHQKPKKMGMTDVMKTEKTTNLQNDGVGANDEVNCNGANISPLVPTSDTIEEIIQSQRKKNEFRVKEPFQASSITACLKFEREEATAVNAIPMAESSKESAGVKAHGQKPNANKQQKLLCSKSLNRRLMPDISFKGPTPGTSIVFNLHNITAPKLKASIKPTLK